MPTTLIKAGSYVQITNPNTPGLLTDEFIRVQDHPMYRCPRFVFVHCLHALHMLYNLSSIHFLSVSFANDEATNIDRDLSSLGGPLTNSPAAVGAFVRLTCTEKRAQSLP